MEQDIIKYMAVYKCIFQKKKKKERKEKKKKYGIRFVYRTTPNMSYFVYKI